MIFFPEQSTYHGVPGMGFVDTGLALPFVLSSSKARSPANPPSPFLKEKLK